MEKLIVKTSEYGLTLILSAVMLSPPVVVTYLNRIIFSEYALIAQPGIFL
jgi:hypothetical protein